MEEFRLEKKRQRERLKIILNADVKDEVPNVSHTTHLLYLRYLEDNLSPYICAKSKTTGERIQINNNGRAKIKKVIIMDAFHSFTDCGVGVGEWPLSDIDVEILNKDSSDFELIDDYQFWLNYS